MTYETTCIHRETTTRGEYTHTRFRVMRCYVRDVREELAGTWDNRAGYGSPEAAEAHGERMRSYLRDGYTLIARPLWDELSISVEYQHYYRHKTLDGVPYCEPTISLGNYPRALAAGVEEFKRITRARRGSKGFPATPDAFAAHYKGALRVDRVEHAGWDWDWLVSRDQVATNFYAWRLECLAHDQRPREWMLTA